MKGSLEGNVEWPETEPRILKSFDEFLYTGDFHIPGFSSLETNPETRQATQTFDAEIDSDGIHQRAWVLFQIRKRYLLH